MISHAHQLRWPSFQGNCSIRTFSQYRRIIKQGSSLSCLSPEILSSRLRGWWRRAHEPKRSIPVMDHHPRSNSPTWGSRNGIDHNAKSSVTAVGRVIGNRFPLSNSGSSTRCHGTELTLATRLCLLDMRLFYESIGRPRNRHRRTRMEQVSIDRSILRHDAVRATRGPVSVDP